MLANAQRPSRRGRKPKGQSFIIHGNRKILTSFGYLSPSCMTTKKIVSRNRRCSRFHGRWWCFPAIYALYLTSHENLSRSVDRRPFGQGPNLLEPTSHRVSTCSIRHVKNFWRLQFQQSTIEDLILVTVCGVDIETGRHGFRSSSGFSQPSKNHLYYFKTREQN